MLKILKFAVFIVLSGLFLSRIGKSVERLRERRYCVLFRRIGLHSYVIKLLQAGHQRVHETIGKGSIPAVYNLLRASEGNRARAAGRRQHAQHVARVLLEGPRRRSLYNYAQVRFRSL